MEREESSAKILLRQQLQALRALVTRLKTLRDSTDRADLEALKALAEGSGTCRFKGEACSDSLDLTGSSQKSTHLKMFLLLLWTSGRLKHAPFDPLDIRIARPVKRYAPQSNSGEMAILAKSENLAEDEDASLIGPLNLDLKRIDSYHPLFSTYRTSTKMRKENFLNSKHISHARELRGLDSRAFGPRFTRSVLERTAPSLVHLHTERLKSGKDLDLLRDLAFPRLRRLNAVMATWWDEDNIGDPPVLFPGGKDHDGIVWMRVRLPRQTLESLLRANAKTLLELELGVGTARGYGGWPSQCGDLDATLERCGVAGTLRRLVLVRGLQPHHSRAECAAQVDAVRGSLPGLTVVCDRCCPDAEGHFEETESWQRSEWPYQLM